MSLRANLRLPAAAGWLRTGALVAVWGLVVLVALRTRPVLPVDETRYLTVAWDMWRTNSFLVPVLNGDPYSHKPPLFFWLMHAGWSFLGVSETWARLIGPLFGLFSLFASFGLARLLWPAAPLRARVVPWLLLGSLSWTVFTTVTMFDMLMVCFTVLALTGVVLACRSTSLVWFVAGWVLAGAGIGLGVLAKGPVIAVYVLPAALLAPLWAKPRHGWIWHYAGAVAAVAIGAAIGLSWALPAAEAGGTGYARAILWGQTAGRISDSFAHERGVWWYLAILPLLLFPWILWAPAWRGVLGTVRNADEGIRLALVWLGAGLLILSFVSGKQPHYLLPLFPAIALLIAAGLDTARWGRWSAALPAMTVMVFGFVLAGMAFWLRNTPGAPGRLDLPEWVINIPGWLGLALAAAGAVTLLVRPSTVQMAVMTLAGQSAAVVAIVHLLGFAPVRHVYDIKEFARIVRQYNLQNMPIAMLDEYHGQFGFLGRLERRMPIVPSLTALQYLAANPRHRLIMTMDQIPPRWMEADFVQFYRGRVLAIVNEGTYEAWLTVNRMRDAGTLIEGRGRTPAAPAASGRPAGRPE